MSRSFKKNPVVNDHKRKTTKDNKKLANRRLRRMFKTIKFSPAPGEHKKMNESYDISDYAWRWTKEQAQEEYASGRLSRYIYTHFPTMKTWLNYWEKCCLRK